MYKGRVYALPLYLIWKVLLMVRKFKKPSGIIIKTDSNVHSKEYVKSCADKFEELKDKPKKKAKKKAGK